MALQQFPREQSTFVAKVDGPLMRATFEARTADQQLRDLGATLYAKVKQLPVWLELSLSARFVFSEICHVVGELHPLGGIVLWKRRDLEASLRVGDRTTSAPLRELVERGVLAHLQAFGNRPHGYAILPDPDEQGARALTPAAAQDARAFLPPATYRAANDPDKTLQSNDLARAGLPPASYREAENCNDRDFSPENAALEDGRALPPPVRTCTSTTFTSKAEEQGVHTAAGEWLLPWLTSLPRMNPKVARRLAARLSPEDALACRIEFDNSPAQHKTNFDPAGLAVHIFKNPHQVKDKHRAQAKELLSAGQHRGRNFAAALIAPTLYEQTPAATPSPAMRAELTPEQWATELQQTMPDAQLEALRREVIDNTPDAFVRVSIAKANPRTSRIIHAAILSRLDNQFSSGGVR